METLSFSFLPKYPPLSLAATPKKHLITISTAKYSSLNPIFQPIKKLITKKFARKISTNIPQEINIVVQGRRKQLSLLELVIFKPLDDFISSFFTNNHLSLPQLIDPKHVLSGNFSPVDELPPTACEAVEGSFPSCLDGGAYIQNGSNPQFIPRGPYHLADGDGMLHSIKISQGKATFCSRFVKTYKYTVERDLGYPVFPNTIALFNINKQYYYCNHLVLLASLALYFARIITGQFNPFINGLGTANTSLSLFAGHLFALVESDLPYSIKIASDGDIITLGRHDFHIISNTNFPPPIMTAHPKIDPETGEAFAFKNFVIAPFLTFYRIDSNGRKHKEVPIFSMKGASFIHDFAVTKKYAVFPDVQIVIDPWEIMRGRTIMRVDPDKVPRLGVIGRYAEDEGEMYWIDVPGLNVLHVINAWDEDDGDAIVIVASNVLPIEHILDRMDLVHLSMEKITIDAKAKKVVNRRPVSDRSLDFGVINPQYAERKNRYIYAAAIETMPKMAGVVKIDLSLLSADSSGDCTVASRMYGTGFYGSEPTFVAREPNNLAAEEDDGYLLSYVHNENTHESQFLVMDAKSPSLEIVAAVKLPRRVPYGFHSIFLKESDLHKL